MIAHHVETEIRRLLAESDYSNRKIAELTGVSRGTVCAISSGKRVIVRGRREDAGQPSGPPRRCPGCGGMVLTPCVLCAARKSVAGRRRAFPAVQNSAAAVGLELRPDHRERYLQVRRWRLEHQGQPFMGSE